MSIKYKSTFLLIIENFEKPSCRQSYQTQQTTKKIFLTKTESIIINLFFPNILIVNSLIDYSLNEEYKKVKRLGDMLADVEPLIDWGHSAPS